MFTHNHITFHSSEQAYLYDKCMRLGDTELAKKILDSRDGKHAKKLSKQLRCVPDWDDSDIARSLMMDICLDKFRDVEACNEAVRKAHMEKKILVEAVWKPGSNNIWGTGLTIEQTRQTKKEGWKGKNQLGDILTRIMHHLFDDWSDDEGNTEPKSESGLTEGQVYRDSKSEISEDTQTADEEYQSTAEEEEGELVEDASTDDQASKEIDIDSLVTENSENVPEHTSNQSRHRAKGLSVGQVKSRSGSSGSASRKRVNTSPKEGLQTHVQIVLHMLIT